VIQESGWEEARNRRPDGSLFADDPERIASQLESKHAFYASPGRHNVVSCLVSTKHA
jgi:hypothetical protein